MKKIAIINYMYRDGANYKSDDRVTFPNPQGLTEAQIISRLKVIGIEIGEQIWFKDFRLNEYGFDSLSPIENPYMMNATIYDHAYHEITSVVCDEVKDNATLSNSISIDMFLVDIYQIAKSVSERRLEAIAEAMEDCKNHMEYMRTKREWYKENSENPTKILSQSKP